MKWLFLLLVISGAAFLFAVFSLPVHVRVQLVLNRRETFAGISLGIIRGLIWFPVYRVHNTSESEDRDLGRLLIQLLEDLNRNPENACRPFAELVEEQGKRRSKGQRKVRKIKHKSSRDTLARRIVTQALKRGLTLLYFNFKLAFGAGNAATTGVTLGVIYALLGTFLGMLWKKLGFPRNRPIITIIPCYNEARFDMEFDTTIVSSPVRIVFPVLFWQN